MLFHVTHTHTWDACPYNDHEKVRVTFGEFLAGIGQTGAKLVGAWVDAPAHKFFLVIDANTTEQVEAAMAPIIDIGCAETRPVSDAAELLKRRMAGK
ncbi:MAG TPA: DUF3303 family protein [Acidimicrobiia bacterium]|nr:DUF3303 family protein [Acidimicrobiia bacterium]